MRHSFTSFLTLPRETCEKYFHIQDKDEKLSSLQSPIFKHRGIKKWKIFKEKDLCKIAENQDVTLIQLAFLCKEDSSYSNKSMIQLVSCFLRIIHG